MSSNVFYLNGIDFSPEDLVHVGDDLNQQVDLSPEAWRNVERGRQVVDNVLDRKEIVYGINTGFGNFAKVIIPEQHLSKLQNNLIRSHAAGVGPPLSPRQTRRLLLLRINVLSKGHSGVRKETLQQLLDALNRNALPYVPKIGSVGASGDLAPLSHLALGLLGEGKMWDVKTGKYQPAMQVLQANGLKPIELTAKEGLALINGTQLIASIGAEALVRARNIARQADVVACLTVEVLKGTSVPFHPAIHATRPHAGQSEVAARARALLNYRGEPRSEIARSHENCHKVQDSYTLRCIPQIHGIVHDTIKFADLIIRTECNSATDNPMIFANLSNSKSASKFRTARSRHGEPHKSNDGVILSGGNFHGEYPAKALDYLTIGIHEIASCSERRVERLVNPTLSGLPAFLVKDGGLNSGFMIAHCTAAALVSENKTLCHPSSVDSLSTSAAQEDHVSMGGFAARKCLQVVKHVEKCIAIELLCACQALDLLRPLRTTEPLERIYDLVRQVVKPYESDRYMAPDIDACVELLKGNKVWDEVRDCIPPQWHGNHEVSLLGPGGASKL